MKIDVLASVFDPPPARVEVDPARLAQAQKHFDEIYGSHFSSTPDDQLKGSDCSSTPAKPAITTTRAMTPEEEEQHRRFINDHLSSL